MYKRPLLIVPPWINKFYILDLREKNSFIKWAVDQGHTVFVISWVNPDERLAAKSFENYMLEGPLDAIDQIEKATGERSVNAIGYCLGGTLLASTLAYLSRKDGGKDKDRIASATFFTTMTDFSDVGEMSVFIDEEQISSIEAVRCRRKAISTARRWRRSFNMLRANDLIWSFVVSNYLLGKEPLPFDLLYWNSDNTRMPAACTASTCATCTEEPAGEAGRLTLAGEPIDLRRSRRRLLPVRPRGPHRAVEIDLCGDAGVQRPGASSCCRHRAISPASSTRPPPTSTATGPAPTCRPIPKLAGKGGPHRRLLVAGVERWVGGYGEGKVPARPPGTGWLPVLEDAPGSYVAARIGA